VSTSSADSILSILTLSPMAGIADPDALGSDRKPDPDRNLDSIKILSISSTAYGFVNFYYLLSMHIWTSK
jgi:hypothetical protein